MKGKLESAVSLYTGRWEEVQASTHAQEEHTNSEEANNVFVEKE